MTVTMEYHEPQVHKVKLKDNLGVVATPPEAPSPVASAAKWCAQIQIAFAAKDADAIVAQFTSDGWWRDILNIDSSDFNSLKTSDIKTQLDRFGVPEISALKVVKPSEAHFVSVANWIQAFIEFETPVGRGNGFIRLRESGPGRGDYKAFTFFTCLWEIKGHEEFAYHRRPKGADHGEHALRTNWLERRQEKVKFENSDPTVLIVGGGQNGLMLAARLTSLGIPTLIIEKNPRVGDSWRNRYHTLCLHDPVWSDHFPYVPFPASWPVFTPKDKIADFMESYASIMELNIWLGSTIQANPTFDATTKKWTITVLRDGAKPRVINASQLVLASGFSGEARLPDFPRSSFRGVAVHSSSHKGGRGWTGKKAVVVGCCNSGHDIAADFYENGVDVTMIQRSDTYVMSSKYGIPEMFKGLYEEGGPATADADAMFTSIPLDLLAKFHIDTTKTIELKDQVMREGLTKAGFKLKKYDEGMFIKYLRDGGGYYIDVGASQLIVDGKIKIKQGKEISRLTEDGVLLEDGVELKADIIVFATGYSSMRETVRRVISDEVANDLGQCWGRDDQGELPGVWRNTGVEHFSLMCGNMIQARIFSKHLALHIQMQELGLAQSGATSFPEYKNSSPDPRF